MQTSRIVAVAFMAAWFLVSPCGAASEPAIVATSPAGHFEFHIDPWISLHHFAYHYVRDQEIDLKLRGDVPLSEGDKDALSPEFVSACAPLRSAYRPYIEGSLLHDRNTRGLAKELWNGPDALSDAAVRNALEACMPAYRSMLWPSHRRASQEILDQLTLQLKAYESKMAEALAGSLESAWPETPLRVDIAAYANWAGAYTDDLPPNITLSSYDETVNEYAFEILFHESAHTGDFSASLDSAANAALEAAGFDNDRYWHYILFYVTGRTVAEVFDNPDYLPYSKAVGLTKRKSASPFYRAMEMNWDKGSSFQERVDLAAKTVAEEQPQTTAQPE